MTTDSPDVAVPSAAPQGLSAGQKIAVIGTGITGMAAAWLLSKRHQVTVLEKDTRVGGHTNTVEAKTAGGATLPVDTGFIVYNARNYPNLVALFEHLGVETLETDMSFAVSVDGGRLEYAGSDLAGLIAQPANLLRPRFWSMLIDLVRFYRKAPAFLAEPGADDMTLGDYLKREKYSRAFVEDHLLPMGAAIWSSPPEDMEQHPAAAFIRFFQNHALLDLTNRPIWRTVKGGSREYLRRLTSAYADRIQVGAGVDKIIRGASGVLVTDATGHTTAYDHVVIACHADDALAMLGDPTAEEQRLLGAFRYQTNDVWLHQDETLMPRRRKAWAAWNYVSDSQRGSDWASTVTYWMNRLQHIDEAHPLFVTLNPPVMPRPETVLHRQSYEHPLFTVEAVKAQKDLWRLQGQGGTWYCGSYFGSGFHEDGLQAGLLVAERLGGLRRPWRVAGENDRLAPWPDSVGVVPVDHPHPDQPPTEGAA